MVECPYPKGSVEAEAWWDEYHEETDAIINAEEAPDPDDEEAPDNED